MPDYRGMYLTMFRASEQAANIVINAQQKCEEMYLSAVDCEIELLPQHDASTEE